MQCLHRWKKVLNPELIKGPWTNEEDLLLVDLVHKYGPKNWSCIAKFLPGRIGKQCRERYAMHDQIPQPFGPEYKQREMDWGGGHDHYWRSQAVRQQVGLNQQVPSGANRQRHQEPLEQHHQAKTQITDGILAEEAESGNRAGEGKLNWRKPFG